jgi:hypothetical protein
MQTLQRELRKELERTVREARRTAEEGARKALEQLAVHHHEPWTTLSPEQRQLRNRLRAHGRQLGDKRNDQRGTQEIGRLAQECAYEHWHRMLFARFLAENDLLIEPDNGVAISLAECEELARSRGEDWLALASSFAVRMLPQIFRQGDPVLEVALPPETRSKLEDLLKNLPRDVFIADDSLGWVYQFWQADRKEEINKSEKKIGADELPAVTQLFTEDYMVLFLLHNTLGAWWAGKVLARNPELARSAKSEDELRAACSVGGIEWTYLRFVRDEAEDGAEGAWRPAAGTFDGWPKAAKEITVLDPCMGSGHFLVFALPILVAFRMAEENLSRETAVDSVLRDNLFGLEIDQRCTQIAAFNLAFAAWRMVRYRELPPLNLACSGLAPGASKAEWMKLAERAAAAAPVPPETNLFGRKDNLFSRRIKDGIARLYDLFAKAPWLGSLIDPRAGEAPFAEATFAELEPVLVRMLARQDDDLVELAVTAQGMAKAAEILGHQFTLATTNVPYLGRRRHDPILREFCEKHYWTSKSDLATCFLERCIGFSSPGGSAALLIPQNVLFLRTFKGFREKLLTSVDWSFICRLGPKSFQTPMWDFGVALTAFNGRSPQDYSSFAVKAAQPMDNQMSMIDVSGEREPETKARGLRFGAINQTLQSRQYANPEHRISFGQLSQLPPLEVYADCLAGIMNGDSPKFIRSFWEIPAKTDDWAYLQSTVPATTFVGGLASIIFYDEKHGHLREDPVVRREKLHNSDERGNSVWGLRGVAISQMSALPAALYHGNKYDSNVAVIVPKHQEDLPAIWTYCSSPEFHRAVRAIDKKLNVTNATFGKIPFDLAHWKKVASEKYPEGLAKPQSRDPREWLFIGRPDDSEAPLHVALARMLGYRWPRQTGSSFLDCPALGPDGLEKHADPDGIVCLNPIKGQPAAEERLRALLSDAFGSDWSATKLSSLLAEAGFENKTLDDWLRDGFFAQHCELFHQRPFIWHIWDGRRDGFNVLVNYHRLAAPNGDGRRTLEKLIYTYLGTWIDLQREAQRQGVDGADARLAAAEHLKRELERILAGEPPYDIFVRWKRLHEQAIGWEPDINDGVRINIRPFMMAKPLGARGANACILRVTPKIKWEKDRGKEPQRPREDFPWFWGWDGTTVDFAGGKTFDGNRWNNLHYTNKFKQAARERHSGAKVTAAR